MSNYNGIEFSDSDVVNLSGFIPTGEYNPHGVRPWLLHDHGFTLAVVFANCLQDALDEAADNDKLDRYKVDYSDAGERDDYLTSDFSEAEPGLDPNCPEFTDESGTNYWWKEGMQPTFLGNASEPFDIDSLQVEELPNPSFSFCSLFDSMEETSKK